VNAFPQAESIGRLFSAEWQQTLCMRAEAAMAAVQARRGIIPAWAAEEIARTANPAFVPVERVAAERERLGHTFVAIIEPWSELLGEAAEWLHFGATSADVLDTVLVQQGRDAVRLFVERLRALEERMLELAREHRATVMIGRTVGRHALPITFGLKVAAWLGENRRNIDRLTSWRERTTTGALSGAVSSYAALGDDAFAVEADFTAELGLGEPWPMDWKGSRDMFAEYGALLAIVAKTWSKIAQELFLLGGDDIREIEEQTVGIGSSTMPHKINPLHSRTVMARARDVTHGAGVLLDWMVSIHERDQVSSADALGTVSNALDRLLRAAQAMLTGLTVNAEAMRANVGRTRGLIMAERAMFLLAPEIGKHTAHHEVRLAAAAAWRNGTTLVDELRLRPAVAGAQAGLAIIDQLDPTCYVGLAPEAVDRTIAFIEARRAADFG
jgi:adenylosuccinate lyase